MTIHLEVAKSTLIFWLHFASLLSMLTAGVFLGGITPSSKDSDVIVPIFFAALSIILALLGAHQ